MDSLSKSLDREWTILIGLHASKASTSFRWPSDIHSLRGISRAWRGSGIFTCQQRLNSHKSDVWMIIILVRSYSVGVKALFLRWLLTQNNISSLASSQDQHSNSCINSKREITVVDTMAALIHIIWPVKTWLNSKNFQSIVKFLTN